MMEDRKGAAISLVANFKTGFALFLFLAALFSGAGAAEFCASTNTGSSFQPGRSRSDPRSLIPQSSPCTKAQEPVLEHAMDTHLRYCRDMSYPINWSDSRTSYAGVRTIPQRSLYHPHYATNRVRDFQTVDHVWSFHANLRSLRQWVVRTF